MTPVPKLVLSYFNMGGRAEPLRLACVLGKIPFTNKGISFQDWPTVKSQYPMGQVPLLEVEEEPGQDKVAIGQSMAILRYLGRLGNLYPIDPIQAMQVDSYVDAAVDASRGLELSLRGPSAVLMSTTEWSKEDMMAMRERLCTDSNKGLPFYLNFFETALSNSESGWIVGNSITIADLALHRFVAWISGGFMDGIPADLVNGYPKLKKHFDTIEALPEVVAFRKNYPTPYPDSFDYVPEASA